MRQEHRSAPLTPHVESPQQQPQLHPGDRCRSLTQGIDLRSLPSFIERKPLREGIGRESPLIRDQVVWLTLTLGRRPHRRGVGRPWVGSTATSRGAARRTHVFSGGRSELLFLGGRFARGKPGCFSASLGWTLPGGEAVTIEPATGLARGLAVFVVAGLGARDLPLAPDQEPMATPTLELMLPLSLRCSGSGNSSGSRWATFCSCSCVCRHHGRLSWPLMPAEAALPSSDIRLELVDGILVVSNKCLADISDGNDPDDRVVFDHR